MVILREAQSLEELCSLIGTEEIDIDEVIDIYKLHPDFDSSRCFPLHHYTKQGKDIAVKRILRKLSEKHPQFHLRRFSVEQFSAHGYVFNEDSLCRVVAHVITRKKRLIPDTVYETLLQLHGAPVFIESTLGGARFGERGRYRLDLLKEALGEEPRHIQIVPPEFLDVSKPFLKHGGYLAPFFMPAEEFKAQIEEALQRHRLHYTKL